MTLYSLIASSLAGPGAPSNSVGVDGAIYLDLDTGRFYGPKTAGAWPPLPGSISAIQDEGSALTTRAALNFTGAGVTAADDSANARTTVTIPGNPAPALVTSLPGSPTDGQEVYYRFTPNVTPGNTTPILWHLRYDATIPCWLPIGDQRPIIANYYTGTSTPIGAGAWGTYDANDPRLQVPLAGTYECETGMSESYGATAAIVFYVSLAKNGTPWAEGGASSAAAGAPYGAAQIRDFNTLAPADVLRQFYFLSSPASTTSITMRARYISARPMRIG